MFGLAQLPSSAVDSVDLRSAGSRAVVFGFRQGALTPQEREFFADCRPLGFIMFRRNCQRPDQLGALVADLRDAVGGQAAIFIDQEGGPVTRLRWPYWHESPGAREIGCLAESDHQSGVRAAWLYGRLLAFPLHRLGIDVNCAPVCDVLGNGCHPAIGDRIFSRDPRLVAELASAACQGMIAGGVLPVIKHMPGHGRSLVDSHHQTPVIDAPLAELENSDFIPFRHLCHMPLAMVAHVVLGAMDLERPASTSPRVIEDLIRARFSYDGLLISDDLVMGGLQGTVSERASAVLAAGCDVVLHADGNLEDMKEMIGVIPSVSDLGWQRWQRALGRLMNPAPDDEMALREELNILLGYRQGR